MSKEINKQLIIKSLKDHYSFKSDKQLAEFLGIATTTLSSWIARNSIDWELIFAKCVDIDFDVLIKQELVTKRKIQESEIKCQVKNCDFMAMIDRKDHKIIEMSEEIGKLKQEVASLKKGGSFTPYNYAAEP